MADEVTEQENGNRRTAKVAVAPSLADNLINADGVQVLALKGGVGQVDLHQVLGATASEGSRVVSHRIVLPLRALMNYCRCWGLRRKP